MVQSCLIRGCSNSYGMRKTLKLHRFPKDVHTRELWMQAINRDGEIKNHWRICSDHFLLSDYDESGSKLKCGSVPTVFTIKKCLECNPNGQAMNIQEVNLFSSAALHSDTVSSNNQHQQNEDENEEEVYEYISDGILQDSSQLSCDEYKENEVQIIKESNMECVSDATLQDDSKLSCDQYRQNEDIEELVSEDALQNDCHLSCLQHEENELMDQIMEAFAVNDVPNFTLLNESQSLCDQHPENKLQSISDPHVMLTCTSLGTQTSPRDDDNDSLEKLKLKRKIKSLQRTLNRRNKKLKTYRRNKEFGTRFDRIKNLLKDLEGKSSHSATVVQLLQSLTNRRSS